MLIPAAKAATSPALVTVMVRVVSPSIDVVAVASALSTRHTKSVINSNALFIIFVKSDFCFYLLSCDLSCVVELVLV